MLTLMIPEKELYDEKKEIFVHTKPIKLELEHSLLSLRKWESIWKKPFLGKQDKTAEETIDYIRCMTITKNVDPNVYALLGSDEIEKIIKYIEDPMTATWFSKTDPNKMPPNPFGEIVTAEIIYYWMITLNIPMECQKWHLEQLITLIKVVSIKNAPEKKMNKREAAKRRQALNAARRAKYKTRG